MQNAAQMALQGMEIDEGIRRLMEAKAAGTKYMYAGPGNPVTGSQTILTEDKEATGAELDLIQKSLTQSIMDRGRTQSPDDLRNQQFNRLKEVHDGVNLKMKQVFVFNGFY